MLTHWKRNRRSDAAESTGASDSVATTADAAPRKPARACLVKLEDILHGKSVDEGARPDAARVQLTLDERSDKLRKPLFREWTLKKSTSTTTAAEPPLPQHLASQPAQQFGPSQDDLRQVEEQFRRGGDPSQVSQWYEALARKDPPPADEDVSKHQLKELDDLEKQVRIIESGTADASPTTPVTPPSAIPQLIGRGRPVERHESAREPARPPVAKAARPLARTHSDSAGSQAGEAAPRPPRRNWIMKSKRSSAAATPSASATSSPAETPSTPRRAMAPARNRPVAPSATHHHLEVL